MSYPKTLVMPPPGAKLNQTVIARRLVEILETRHIKTETADEASALADALRATGFEVETHSS